jgi:hypothetical protein
MKILRNIFFLVLSVALVTVTSCGNNDDDGPSDIDRFVGTWTASSVTLDGNDVTSPEYTGFTVTFNDDGSYITTNGDPIFTNTGGFWSISSVSDQTVQIDVDGVPMTAVFGEGNNSVIVTFTATDSAIGSAARVEGLVGDYAFTLNKQQ